MDIGLIIDKANEEAARGGPRVDVQPLCENLADMVEKAQGDDYATSDPTESTQAKSASALEDNMPTLFQHIQPWMHISIAKAEDWIEKKIALQTELKI